MTIASAGSVGVGRRSLASKRALDLVGASVGILLLSPFLLALAIAVKLTSRGPILFRQERMGIDGSTFVMFKYRSMRPGGDDRPLREQIERELAGEAVASEDGSFKVDNDPRVTPFGRWLRRSSLDELPQLLNVLKGEMSLVGPRPCLPWESRLFPPEYSDRWAVPPGITGLWQVSGRSTLTTLEMLELDVKYAHEWTVRMDIGIVLKTVPSLLRGDGAK
jgi:lipopolysaccharide/colanic/teichoic acid biosynthesis glycosyltransferase